MLIVKNLKKTYKTKGGVEVHALDDVSVTFPESGMVFLLGKSGSGKSTLLNMIGGLDRVDSGEIIVKGKNSKTFSGSDYDSYRNTFIGFIFQEYNILNEFNVEQNISLALQLQGKPNDKKVVEEILEQVDLKGLGKRKPNTLSGGQKQRVAIARALIKNPEIIMADEPTGALDSNTGKQVFETLKKLSKDKLVIVVSHDRDFAEYYGDRIIELSDGKIISDTTKEYVTPDMVSSNVHVINDHTVAIKDTSKLSDEDMKQIAKVLKKQKGEAVISSGDHDLTLVRQAIHLNSDNSSEVFNDTGDIETKEYDGSKTKFTKSKLPFARAFKMGSSNLKLKPIRFIFTTFLTIVALVMFGLTSTLMLFRESYSVYKALKSADYTAEIVSKYYKYTDVQYEINYEKGTKVESSRWDSEGEAYFDDEEIASMNKNNNSLTFAGLITFGNGWGTSRYSFENTEELNDYYRQEIIGFCEADSQFIEKSNMQIIAGEYPTNSDEILISKYHYEVIKLCTTGINSYDNLINKNVKLEVRGNRSTITKNFVVSGIYDAGEIPSNYDSLKSSDELSERDREKLQDNYAAYLSSSFQCVIFVHPDFYTTYSDTLYAYNTGYGYYNPGISIRGLRISDWGENFDYDISEWDGVWNVGTDKILPYASEIKFYDVNGKEIEYKAPEDGQIYLSMNRYGDMERDQLNGYYDNCNELINSKDYNKSLYDLVSGKEDIYYAIINRLREKMWGDSYPEGFDYETDRKTIDDLMEKYYVDVATKRYVDDMCYSMENGFHWEIPEEERDTYVDFTAFREKVEQFRQERPNNFNELNYLINYLSKDTHGWLKHYSAYDYSGWWYDRYTYEEQEQVNVIRNKYENNPQSVSPDEYEFLQSIVEKYGEPNEIHQLTFDTSWIKAFPDISVPNVTYKNVAGKKGTMEVIGYVDGYDMFLKHDYAKKLGTIDNSTIWTSERETSYQGPENPKYRYVITHSAYTQGQVDLMIKQTKTCGYSMNNRVYNNLQMMLSLISLLKTIFLIVGIVSGVFAALMLLNFIATSIAAKTKEIGILRAVGARGSDLFKIFFSESGLIAAICSAVAIIASAIACWRLNVMMADEVGIALLDFNILNVGLILVGAVIIAILGTLVPVILAARKPPVESIRSL